MEYKKLGILGICSTLSMAFCFCEDASGMNSRRAAKIAAMNAKVAEIQEAAVKKANKAMDDIKAAEDLNGLVAVQDADLKQGVKDDADALAGMRAADSVAAMAAVPNANFNAGFTNDANALAGMRAADSVAAMAAVPNANLSAAFTAKLPFLNALVGDSLANLADNAWAVAAFDGGKFNNDNLARILKAAYGQVVHGANSLDDLDGCIAANGTVLADAANVAQTLADCHNANGGLDDTLADLKGVGAVLNQGGQDQLAPVFDRLIRRLLVLSAQ